MRSSLASLLVVVVALGLVASCQEEGSKSDESTPPLAPSVSAASIASASPPYDPPPPGEGWIPIDPDPAKGMGCTFFGARSAAACEELSPQATWQRERGRIRLFRAIALSTGKPRPIKRWKFYGKVTQLGGGMSLMELQQAATIQYWVVSGSRVLEAEGDAIDAASLRETFVAWARRVVEETRADP